MKKHTKKIVIVSIAIFMIITIFVPTVSYSAIASEYQCSIMGMTPPGMRHPCVAGIETLLNLINDSSFNDFYVLLIKGVAINFSISVILAFLLVYLKRYVKS